MTQSFVDWFRNIRAVQAHVRAQTQARARTASNFTREKPVLIVCGPTASGKTALSLEIARLVDSEIISADSRQVYVHIDIGSDKISSEIRAEIPHHLVDIRMPDQVYTAAEFKCDAEKIIDALHAQNKLPIIVGGTGLYLRMLTENFMIPNVAPNIAQRAAYQKIADEGERGRAALYELLVKKDPDAAARIHRNNVIYVIRALEIADAGKSEERTKRAPSPYNFYMMGVEWPREELYKRIDQRVDEQIRRGLIDEVRALRERYGSIKGGNPNAPALSSLGCKELIPYIEGKITLEQAVATIKKNTRNYAKRQITWFKKDKNTQWLTPSEVEPMIKEVQHIVDKK